MEQNKNPQSCSILTSVTATLGIYHLLSNSSASLPPETSECMPQVQNRTICSFLHVRGRCQPAVITNTWPVHNEIGRLCSQPFKEEGAGSAKKV